MFTGVQRENLTLDYQVGNLLMLSSCRVLSTATIRGLWTAHTVCFQRLPRPGLALIRYAHNKE